MTRRTFLLALAGLGVAPHAAAPAAPAGRPGEPAPEITGGPWLNSSPLTMAGLRGRVVVVELWTYG